MSTGDPFQALALELFVQGPSAQAAQALDAIHWVCKDRLRVPYTLEVIDVHLHPERTRDGMILVTPALLRRHPEPVLRITGSLTRERVLEGLGDGRRDA